MDIGLSQWGDRTPEVEQHLREYLREQGLVGPWKRIVGPRIEGSVGGDLAGVGEIAWFIWVFRDDAGGGWIVKRMMQAHRLDKYDWLPDVHVADSEQLMASLVTFANELLQVEPPASH